MSVTQSGEVIDTVGVLSVVVAPVATGKSRPVNCAPEHAAQMRESGARDDVRGFVPRPIAGGRSCVRYATLLLIEEHLLQGGVGKGHMVPRPAVPRLLLD